MPEIQFVGCFLTILYLLCKKDKGIFHINHRKFFSFSTDVEEVTFDPNSQWEPVPVKQEPKDEECQGPQPAKKARPSPPDSLPLSGVRTPTSQMSSSSGHYSPYQTQPPSNPGMGVPTPPGRTPPETHGSSGGGQLQEHNLDTSGCTLAATTPSGEWVDVVVQGNASLLATFPSFCISEELLAN